MDLGSESVEENEVNHDGNENGTNDDGSSGNDKFGLGFDGNLDANNILKPDQKGTVDLVGSEEAGNSKGTPKKGVGLRKWKRMRRSVVKDPNSSADSSKILKRGLSGNANLNENQPFQRDARGKSEGSSNMFGNVGFSDGFAIHGSSSDSRYALGSGFVVGTNSENSEDRSSKSSTAASEPRLRYEKSHSRSVNSKNFANSAQRVQQGKGRIESNKKPGGGGRVKMEKENPLSSMETDSRSSNFKQGIFVTSNGKHSGRPNDYDGGNGVEAHTNEHFKDGVQASYGNEKVGEDEDLLEENLARNLPWDVAEEKSDNNQSPTIEDTLFESISGLQAVQEALEKEVMKFREIGIEVSPDDDSAKFSSGSAGVTAVNQGLHNSCSSGQSGSEEIKQNASCSLEFQVSSLKQNVNILESNLGELQGMLALKDSRIAELETALSNGKFPKQESASTVGLSEKELEFELEDLFRQKIEAEVEYLVITKAMKSLKDGAGFQLTLLEEQEKLSENQVQVLNKVIEAESKASLLKNKAEELEKYCGDNIIVEESFVLQKRVCKVTFCLFLQFMLLLLFFWLFVSQLWLDFGVVVPT